ncbi:MAG: D-alanyl-D-alanine carboxypeptidase/D-alanyl-D-alanine-endopeptidase, partial [Rhodobacterales bacterium]|nr:D-alanyl-D-alanine carboxypeptidase/D-alanyl-D-alanine-endopeptidase [Rhodobacterales bacterium]
LRAAPPAPRAPEATALIAEARLGGATGLAVADAASGRLVETLGHDTPLPPASTAKAITALYALDRLGPGFRFATRLIATGPVQGGVIAGDLVLAGTGDPTLDTDALAQMAQALAAQGVRGVQGRFLLHAGGVPRLDRIATDQPDHVGYNPAISGLNLNFNRVHFEWRRGDKGYALAMDARSERVVPPVGMARMAVVDRDLPVYTYRGGNGTDDWTVARSALGGGGARWLPVRQPEAYAGDVFRTLARARGLDLPPPRLTPTLPAGRVLVDRPSAPLPDLLRDMLKHSTNLTAEVLGLSASGAGGLPASGRAMGDWARARYGRAGRFVDHSGLGADSRVTAADLVAALTGAQGGPLPGLLKPFALRDAQGRELRGHPVRVHAKTGTLNFVSALAGYAVARSGRVLAFAVISADPARRAALPPEAQEAPPGGRDWARRARLLQSRLIERWTTVHA